MLISLALVICLYETSLLVSICRNELETWSVIFIIFPLAPHPGCDPKSSQIIPVHIIYGNEDHGIWSNQFISVTQSCLILCDPRDCSTPGLPVHHQILKFTQTHVHWVSDAVQPSHLLSSPSPPTFYLSQHQGLFKWVSSFHQVAKVLEYFIMKEWWF